MDCVVFSFVVMVLKNVTKIFQNSLHSDWLCVTILVLICVEVVDGYAKT